MMKNTQKSYKATFAKLGPNIQRLRLRKGYTQKQLAYKLGITRVYMGYIEQGRENPSLSLMVKIAKELGVKMNDLVQE